jgi:uncharacterized protein YaaR (DUF327 family)
LSLMWNAMSSFNRIGRLSRSKGMYGPGPAGRPAPEITAAPFPTFLETAADNQDRQQLTALLAEIDRWGEQLCANPRLGTLRGFRDAVRRFVQSALLKTYRIKEESYFDRGGRYKVLTTVARIDQELERLAAMVMDEESSRPEIRSMVEQLKGILVDLMG